MSPWSLALARRVRAEYGLDLSPTQIERGRKLGVIPSRPADSRTRWRPGLANEIPEDEVARAAALASVLAHKRLSPDDLTVGLAAAGIPKEKPAQIAAATRALAAKIIDSYRVSDVAYTAAQRRHRALRPKLLEQLRAHGEDESVLEEENPVTELPRPSTRGFFDELERGVVDGTGAAGHLGRAANALAALGDDEICAYLRFVRAECDAKPSATELVERLLDLLTRPGRGGGQLRAMAAQYATGAAAAMPVA